MLLQAGQQVLDAASAVARQIVAAALAAGNFEVVWWSGAGAICVGVALAAAGIRGPADEGHRRLRRSGRALGMNTAQTRLLHHLLGVGHYRQQRELFRNRALLDAILQRGREAFPRPVPGRRDAHLERIAALLSIKARIEAGGRAAIRSLSSCAAGTPLILAPLLKPSIETRVIASLGDEMACAVPGKHAGDARSLRRGTLVSVRRAAPAGPVDGVLATVLGSAPVAGERALLIARRSTPRSVSSVQGRPRRCVVTAVTAASLRRRQDRRPRRASALGSLVSLDTYWAGIRSVAPVAAGRLVKLEIELGPTARLPLYGKVVRSPRRNAGGGVMLVHLTGQSRSRIHDLYRFADESRGSARFRMRAWPA